MVFEVEDVLPQLKLQEKIDLLSGVDFWHTASVPRLHIPSIRLSDGPNGVRGTKFFMGEPTACLPCGTALAATWDTELIEQGGKMQADEALLKGASVILGPTTNMQRSPLGGRGFESYSEDPHLAGTMAAATVKGIQSKGVSATIKHFVCNDGEHERMAVNAIVSDRALREIYLMPFQIAQRDADPWCYMTAYNRVNGTHASENPRILRDILRKEWGFDGLVMSDWFGTYSTTEAIKAGLDLEMPGPSYIRGGLIRQALHCQKLRPKDIDDRAREVLKLVKKVEPLGIPENAEEKSEDTPEKSALLRKIAGSSMVLMKNENKSLPLKKDKSIAVIGPNAKYGCYSGGGSASVRPLYVRTPWQGVTSKVDGVKYALGAIGYNNIPDVIALTKAESGVQGRLDLTFFDQPPEVKDRKPFHHMEIDTGMIMLGDFKHETIKSVTYWSDITGKLTAEASGRYVFALTVSGIAKLYIDGKEVVDNQTHQQAGDSFFGSGTREERGSIELEKGKTYDLLVQFGTAPMMNIPDSDVAGMGAGGVNIGGTIETDADKALQEAVALAKEVDQVVVCTGLNAEWESEGFDRPHMRLPPNNDKLIEEVVKANPNTVVVINSGCPVEMPWRDSVAGIVQSWYFGNEGGNAVADVLFGDVNPSGKLSLSFPISNENNPAYLNYRADRGRTLYGEDIYIGYRYYEETKQRVAYPFGHGLSYTTFEMSDLQIKESGDNEITVAVNVKNTGEVDGAQVVQVYVSQKAPSLHRPPKELKGFAKALIKAGEAKTVEIKLNKKYAASFWDEERSSWIMEKDEYAILVGDSSASVPLKGTFDVTKTIWWNGL